MLKAIGFKSGKARTAALKDRKRMDWVWVDIFDPTEDDIRAVSEEFSISLAELDDIMDLEDVPRIEKEKDYSIVFFRTPSREETTSTIAAIIGKDFLITFHKEKNVPAKRAFSSALRSPPSSPMDGLVLLIDKSLDLFDDLADSLEKYLDKLEERILKGEVERAEELFRWRERIGEFYRSLLLNKSVLKKLKHPEAGDMYYEALNLLDEYAGLKETVVNLINLHMNIQNIKMQEVMKFLAGVTVIAAIPTVISGIYGMNFIHLPLASHPLGFWIALALILVLMALGFIYFKGKGWI